MSEQDLTVIIVTLSSTSLHPSAPPPLPHPHASSSSPAPPGGGRSSYCAAVHRTFKAQETRSNGAAVWADHDAPEVIYTCPDCQELAETSGSR